jgi:hypothetical protein
MIFSHPPRTRREVAAWPPSPAPVARSNAAASRRLRPLGPRSSLCWCGSMQPAKRFSRPLLPAWVLSTARAVGHRPPAWSAGIPFSNREMKSLLCAPLISQIPGGSSGTASDRAELQTKYAVDQEVSDILTWSAESGQGEYPVSRIRSAASWRHALINADAAQVIGFCYYQHISVNADNSTPDVGPVPLAPIRRSSSKEPAATSIRSHLRQASTSSRGEARRQDGRSRIGLLGRCSGRMRLRTTCAFGIAACRAQQRLE